MGCKNPLLHVPLVSLIQKANLRGDGSGLPTPVIEVFPRWDISVPKRGEITVRTNMRSNESAGSVRN